MQAMLDECGTFRDPVTCEALDVASQAVQVTNERQRQIVATNINLGTIFGHPTFLAHPQYPTFATMQYPSFR